MCTSTVSPMANFGPSVFRLDCSTWRGRILVIHCVLDFLGMKSNCYVMNHEKDTKLTKGKMAVNEAESISNPRHSLFLSLSCFSGFRGSYSAVVWVVQQIRSALPRVESSRCSRCHWRSSWLPLIGSSGTESPATCAGAWISFMLQQTFHTGNEILPRTVFITEHARHQPDDRVDDDHRGDFAAPEDEVADGDFVRPQNLLARGPSNLRTSAQQEQAAFGSQLLDDRLPQARRPARRAPPGGPASTPVVVIDFCSHRFSFIRSAQLQRNRPLARP